MARKLHHTIVDRVDAAHTPPIVQVGLSPYGGRGLFAQRDIKTGEVLLHVPRSHIMNRDSSLHQLPHQLSEVLRADKTERYAIVIQLLLALERSAREPDDSVLCEYLRSLPKRVPLPLLWPNSSLLELQPEALAAFRPHHALDVLGLLIEYGYVKSLVEKYPHLLPPSVASYSKYRHAHCLIRSRALPGPNAAPHLVPGVDLINHVQGATQDKGELQPDGSWLLIAAHDYAAGQEIVCVYNPDVDNTEYLLNFGFVPHGNPQERVVLPELSLPVSIAAARDQSLFSIHSPSVVAAACDKFLFEMPTTIEQDQAALRLAHSRGDYEGASRIAYRLERKLIIANARRECAKVVARSRPSAL
eukprot:TRINITY_DN9459_c0_g1_i1.p1 TRINITY_DN9459_c0_g1~~TRINITY_DN9459_c0_g1_i1.p1  ORF type:complete len:359 (+),score=54.42 TRINITY_DN9459_c0_g1_i1:650-1726(+)